MTDQLELATCPACHSRVSREIADSESMRREIEELWSFQLRRLRSGVPVRSLVDRVTFSQHPPVRLAECAVCGTVYRNPRESEESLLDLYEDDAPDPAALEALFDSQRTAYRQQAATLTRLAGRRGTGLEVGSYIGAFLAAARETGWSFEGIDVNETAVAFAGDRGLRSRAGTLETMDPDRRFDAIAIWNCFDQLSDPRAVLRAARRLLAQGGLLALRVPNGGFYARWRPRLAGRLAPLARVLLAHNNLLGFPYRHGFTPASLEGMLVEAGFTPVHTRGDTLVPIADRWTRRWAASEERAVKAVLRAGRTSPARMPWFESYARPL